MVVGTRSGFLFGTLGLPSECTQFCPIKYPKANVKYITSPPKTLHPPFWVRNQIMPSQPTLPECTAPRNKPLLRAYQPLVSLNQAFFNPCFYYTLGGQSRLTSHETSYRCFFFFTLFLACASWCRDACKWRSAEARWCSLLAWTK